ncbi:MAG: hypothetical protein ACE5LB_16190 [Acidiferrobacterales bacterium]
MFETLCVILLAIALDRFMPAHLRFDPFQWCRRWAETIEQRLSSGERSQGITALLLAIVPVVLLVFLLRLVLAALGWPLRFVFDVLVLAWCLDLYRLVDGRRKCPRPSRWVICQWPTKTCGC